MSDYGGAGWGLGPNTEAIREWRMRVQRRVMTTRFEDVVAIVNKGSPTVREAQQVYRYLRDLYLSHEALLKATKEARTDLETLEKRYDITLASADNLREAIRAAEELER